MVTNTSRDLDAGGWGSECSRHVPAEVVSGSVQTSVPPKGGIAVNRPQSTEAEYLARMVPPSVASLSRRAFCSGWSRVGAAIGGSALLAACGGSSSSRSTSTAAGSGAASSAGGERFASRRQVDAPKKTMQTLIVAPPTRAGRHGQGQHGRPQHLPGEINNYLQGSPDDVFTWFAGYRMRFFAARAWPATSATSGTTSARTSPTRFKTASTGDDGKQYFVPIYNYPWVALLPQERLRGQGLPAARRRSTSSRRSAPR